MCTGTYGTVADDRVKNYVEIFYRLKFCQNWLVVTLSSDNPLKYSLNNFKIAYKLWHIKVSWRNREDKKNQKLKSGKFYKLGNLIFIEEKLWFTAFCMDTIKFRPAAA